MKKLLPKTINNPHGFTLVELLVVISIIAILSVIGMAIFTGVQKNARDARRREEIAAIATALEANKTDSTYIILATTQFASGTIPATDPQANLYCANATASIQPATPTAAWTATCPTGYGAVGTNPPAGTAWKVCTWLEGSAAAFCKTNVQ